MKPIFEHLEGEISGQYMPHDREYGEDRYSVNANLRGSWNNFGYGINYNRENVPVMVNTEIYDTNIVKFELLRVKDVC